MDGYSVQEAASVLGVAEGRVWELLARGVLLGTPEGDSMRVFLKAQPGPIASAGTQDESPRTNGNGGSHATGEASAFRELLTEFRNLTERYGQALLALGEARGEVAGLRSRVDQLEARLDLRLPPPLDAAPVAWEPATSDVSVDPPPAPPERITPTRKPVRPARRARKAPSRREAVAGFADALARAQDPNPPDLGEAAAVPERPSEASAPPITATPETPGEPMPEEVAAEEVAVEIEAPTYSAVVVEPDWFADGDFAWLDAANMEAHGGAEPSAAAPAAAKPEPEAVVEAESEPQAVAEAESEPQAVAEAEPEPQAVAEAEPEPEAVAEAEPVPEPEAVAEAEPEPEPEAVAEPEPEPQELAESEVVLEAEVVPEIPAESQVAFEAEAEFEPWQPPEPSVPEVSAEPAVAEVPEPPTTRAAVAVEDVEEEVMWLGAEPDPSPMLRDEPPVEDRAQADAWPAVDTAKPVMEVVRPPLAMTEDELARLALDEGWDDAEVAAIRAMITPPATSTVDLPGATELHEAMAALEAVPVQASPAYDVSRQWAKPAPDDDEPAPRDDWAFEPEPAPPPPTASRPPNDVTSALRRAVADPGWLRRRQGPAAAAYRRLRRLFPG